MADPQSKEELLMRREKFAERFLEHPIIYFVVRSWLLSWRARIGMVIGILAFFGVVLGIPRMWRVTPKDFQPVVRVSFLDLVKARALEHNAKKYMAQGRTDYGIMAYHAAIAHNAGNLPRIRTFLQHIITRQRSLELVEMDVVNTSGLRMAHWLRSLSKEKEDIALVAAFYDALEFDDDLLFLLEENPEGLPDSLLRMQAKALLRLGYVERFESSWKANAAAQGWEKDPELQLYRLAATGGFGPEDKRLPAKLALKDRLLEGENKVTANRLYALVTFERREVDEYLTALRRLEEWRKDRLLEHSRAWVLLSLAGRKEEALKMADQFNRAPRTALETSQLAAAYTDLGMMKDAQKLLDQFIERFGFFERLWVQQGTLLAANKEWTTLRNLIAKMRLDPTIAHRMEGFSYYLEGRSELGEGRPSAAYELFQRVPEHGVPNVEVAFTIIDQMRSLGHLDIAAKLISQAEEEARDYPRYWMFVVQLGTELKNEELILRATEQYFRLRPDEPAAKNNFAAALLAARQRPAEAQKLTLEMMTIMPHFPAFQLNHAAALALNSRYAEAEELLETVELGRLNEVERAMYYFALTEALVGQSKLPRAEAAAGKIQERYLFPRQLDALSTWKQKFHEASAPKEAASKS